MSYTSELENENETLCRKLEALEREIQCRSPTKSPKKPKVPSLSLADVRMAAGSGSMANMYNTTASGLNHMTAGNTNEIKSPAKTPGRKVTKLTARKWDLMDENEMDAFESY